MIEENASIGDRYICLEQIGQGGVGAVYRCHDPVMDNIVAVKVLIGDSSHQEMMRFHQEAKATAKLDHPNIIKILDFGESEGRAFLVMEFLEGDSLEDLIYQGEESALGEDETLDVFRQISSGLAYAHGQDVLHRDIKPSNVMICRGRNQEPLAKLCDFGLAKVKSDDQELTRTGTTLGSPSYMSPECVNGREADVRSDIYSLGCLFFELLTRRLPFQGDSAFETMLLRTEQEAPSIKELSDKPFLNELEELVSRCVQMDRGKRYESVSELMNALDQLPGLYELFEEESDELEEDDELSGELPFQQKGARWPLELSIFLVLLIGALLVFRYLFFEDREHLVSNKMAPIKQKVSAVEAEDFEPTVKKEVIDGQVWITLYGVASDKNLKVFKGRKDITHLKLVADDMAGPGTAVLADLPLLGLDLKQSVLSETTLENISKIKTLKVLSLNRSIGLTKDGLNKLTTLEGLEELDLGELPVTDVWIDTIIKFPGLKKLSFRRCDNFEGSTIDRLASLNKLEYLNLTLCGIKRENLKRLARLKSLNRIDFMGIAMDDDDLKVFKNANLKEIDLSGTGITIRSLPTLKTLKSLRHISLPGPPGISSADMVRFRKELPLVLINNFR